jgi:hypothetical protein
MKAFRSTFLLAVVVFAVWGLVKVFDPTPEPISDAPPKLFVFEKQDVVRVQVDRPDDTLVLAETDDGWLVESTGFPASKSMVNRVKHQLHDLTARATVVEDPDEAALYGLANQGIKVTLTFRDASTLQFLAGDPNPSSVSYYIRPIPGDAVYTVKKSAVDYYALTLNEFRERRFASFDSKDADALEAELPGGRSLRFQRVGERLWEMLAPTAMYASRDEVRSLLGRVAALKVQDFIEDMPADGSGDLGKYGLATPRARFEVRFGSREPLVLLMGDPLSDDEDESHAYFMLGGERTVYTAKQGLLKDYLQDTAEFRLRRFMRVDHDDVATVELDLQPGPDDEDLSGVVSLRYMGDVWQWGEDGRPVPGSTPERVAMRTAGVKAEEFVDDAPRGLSAYGLDTPRATVTLRTEEGKERTLLLGSRGPSRFTHEDREIERYYAMVMGEDPIYLVDRGVLSVLKDAIREHRRKLDKDEDKAERREKMDEELGEGEE